MNDIVSVRSLVKTFGTVRALDGLDLTVTAGEALGFLGPNGAGKSTTLRVLLGQYRADAGSASVFGLDSWRDADRIHRRIAYVPGDVALWPNLTGGEAIDLLTRLRGGDVADRARLVEAFALDPTRRCKSYSKGNRQKVALVAAFTTPADLLVFDEPTSGLDPLMETVFRQEVARARDRGATVLLSSHILSEVEHLCDRVTIVRAGRAVETGSLAQLRHLSASRVTYTGDTVPPVDGLENPERTTDATGATHVTFTARNDALPAVLGWLAEHPVDSLTVAPPSLEELFLRHYGPEDPGAADAPGRRSGGNDARHAASSGAVTEVTR